MNPETFLNLSTELAKQYRSMLRVELARLGVSSVSDETLVSTALQAYLLREAQSLAPLIRDML